MPVRRVVLNQTPLRRVVYDEVEQRFQDEVSQYFDERKQVGAYLDVIRKRQEAERRDKVVLDRLYDILTVDPSEVVEHLRLNCRYCHGDNHEYQRKDWELERDLNNYIARGNNPSVFNQMGGGGFNEHANPNPNCPNCHGHGIGKTYVQDTRFLSQRVKNAISSIKSTKGGGVEIKFHDWLKAFQTYAQLRGLIIERKQVSVLDLSQMPEEQLDRLLEQSAPLIDNDDPEFSPFVEMLKEPRE